MSKVPKNLKSLVLYKFNCSCNCIGKTCPHYQVRLSEHLGISKITNLPLKYCNKTTTAIRHHTRFCNRNNTAVLNIICSAKNDYHLKIKESLNILRENP